MKILVAPSAYKGTISPLRLAQLIACGIRATGKKASIELAPLADGGDGTIEVLNACLDGELVEVKVLGATGKPVVAQWLKIGSTAVVELASACGMAMLEKSELSPLMANTRGLGQVISNCLAYTPSRIVVALGGSASTDGASGALSALGVRFLDRQGRQLPLGGAALHDLAEIDLTQLDQRLSGVSSELAADVRSPLLGELGAARSFAPQKGASGEEVEELENALSRYADVFEVTIGKKLRDVPGAGAAGGSAFGLIAALGASLRSGFSIVSELIDLPARIGGKDLVVTAEGRLDRQSFQGKATGELARLCSQIGCPLWVIPASVASDLEFQNYGIERVFAASKAGQSANEEDVIMASKMIFAEPDQSPFLKKQ